MKKALSLILVLLMILAIFSIFDLRVNALSDYQLTANSFPDIEPSWRSDGARIVYVEYTDASWSRHIESMSSDGSGKAQLTTGYVDQAPSYSPDSAKVAFQRYGLRGDYFDLMTMDADGTNLQRITFGGIPGKMEGTFEHPRWSLDGTKLIFHYGEGTTGGTPIVAWWVCSMNVDGTDLQVLGRGMYPRFCCYDTKVLFQTDLFYPDGQCVALMNADGTGAQILTSGPSDKFPDMSSVTNRILFTRGGDLCTMNRDGSSIQQITTDGTIGIAEWSPDEQSIVFSSGRTGNEDIWKMEAPACALEPSHTLDPTDDLYYYQSWEPAPTWAVIDIIYAEVSQVNSTHIKLLTRANQVIPLTNQWQSFYWLLDTGVPAPPWWNLIDSNDLTVSYYVGVSWSASGPLWIQINMYDDSGVNEIIHEDARTHPELYFSGDSCSITIPLELIGNPTSIKMVGGSSDGVGSSSGRHDKAPNSGHIELHTTQGSNILDPWEYCPYVYLDNGYGSPWNTSPDLPAKVLYTGTYFWGDLRVIQYWFCWNIDYMWWLSGFAKSAYEYTKGWGWNDPLRQTTAAAGSADWEPVFVIVNSAGSIDSVLFRWHYVWLKYDLTVAGAELFHPTYDKTHVKLWWAIGSHTPLTKYLAVDVPILLKIASLLKTPMQFSPVIGQLGGLTMPPHYELHEQGMVYPCGMQEWDEDLALNLGFDSSDLKYVNNPTVAYSDLQPWNFFDDLLSVFLDSPANILVTAPNGLRVGYDSVAQTVVDEIDGATYSGPGTEPQVVNIPFPLPGVYNIDIVGVSSGVYTITVWSMTADTSLTSVEANSGGTVEGKVDHYSASISGTGEIKVVSWEYVFDDTIRGTKLKISTDDKYFQFIAPNKDFGIRKDTHMGIMFGMITIQYSSNGLYLSALIMNSRSYRYCNVHAIDLLKHKGYVLVSWT